MSAHIGSAVMKFSKPRISHIVDWSDGQAWTAVLQGPVIIGKFTNLKDAQAFYRQTRAALAKAGL